MVVRLLSAERAGRSRDQLSAGELIDDEAKSTTAQRTQF